MARVLLYSAPYLPGYMRNARCDFVSLSATQWYPILLGWCGAWLEGLGHTVRLLDGPAADLSAAAAVGEAVAFKPDLIVLYVGRLSLESDLAQLAEMQRRCPVPAIIVGPYANIDPDKVLQLAPAGVPMAVGPFDRQVAAMADGVAVRAIPGLKWREADGSVTDTGLFVWQTEAEVAAMPFVSRFLARQVRPEWYRTPSEPFPYMDMMTGRGCAWGRCTFCLWVHTFIRGPVYRQRPIEHVVAEFLAIEREMPQVQAVMIQDDTFTAERAQAFAAAKVRAGSRLPWSCYSRANMPYDVLRSMKAAGCLNLHVGFESGSDRILRQIGKGVTVADMRRFARDAHRAGVRLHGDFMIGYPGETEDEVRATLRLALAMDPDTVQFQTLIPFVGTPLHRLMHGNGWLDANGEPDMPQLSRARIRELAKQCYRRFYLSARYALKCVRSPRIHLAGKAKTIAVGLKSMLF